jgi:hypothetical protein
MTTPTPLEALWEISRRPCITELLGEEVSDSPCSCAACVANAAIPAARAQAEALRELREALETLMRPLERGWHVSDMPDRIADVRAALARTEAQDA